MATARSTPTRGAALDKLKTRRP
ncbi:MAG: hypothetical protein RL669_1103, partial [Pseudomonadota bacterium]